MALWAASFFLPAFDIYGNQLERVAGFGAVRESMVAGLAAVTMLSFASPKDGASNFLDIALYLVYGTMWMANVVMLVSPVVLRRIEQNKWSAGPFACFLILFSLEACVFIATSRQGNPKLHAGSYVWTLSLVGTSLLFLIVRLTDAAREPKAHTVSKPRP